MSGASAYITGGFNKLYIYETCTFHASTPRLYNIDIKFVGGGTCTLNTNNAPAQNITISAGYPGNAATLNINGTLNLPGSYYLGADAGTLNTNNNAINVGYFFAYNGGTANLGSSTVTLTKSTSGNVLYAPSGGTINYGTSTIKIATTYASGNTLSFDALSQTFYNLEIATSYPISLGTGSHSFNNITNSVQPATLNFPASYTQTVSSFSLTGTSGNLVTLNTSSGSGTFTLSKASGVVSVDYLSITNSTATGGASWFAGVHSTNGGGNTGWFFTSPAAGLLTFW